jgi:enamine deaminase RidA (YjgF/YER057c/UK114 family)
MPHKRHRLHNIRDQHPERNIQSDMCSVVLSGNGAGSRIFVRGQVGYTIDAGDRKLMGLGDAGAQADQAMKNVRQLLDEVGAKLEDICKVKVWVIDRAYLEPVMNVIGRHLQGIYPAYIELIVDGLARPEMLMEVDVEVVRSAA